MLSDGIAVSIWDEVSWLSCLFQSTCKILARLWEKECAILDVSSTPIIRVNTLVQFETRYRMKDYIRGI